MRTLIVAAAALLAVGTTSPVIAASPAPTTSNNPDLVQALPGAGAAGLTTVRKKKKEAATIKSISSATRGKQVKIRVQVAKADRRCELELQWNDGSSADVADVDARTNKYCTFTVDVPDEKGISGKAHVNVTVKTATDKKMTEVEGEFTVK